MRSPIELPLWRVAEVLYPDDPGKAGNQQGGNMKITGPLPYLATLTILAVLGLVGIIMPSVLAWKWDHGVINELGVAFLIAAILGATIDRWMKTSIAKDVFEAAFGFLVPEEFKKEIRRILGHRFMCIKHEMHFSVNKLDAETVRVTTSTERVFRNITNSPERLTPLIHIDDWGYNEKSEIIKLAVVQDGKSIEISEREIGTDSTVKATGDQFVIQANEHVSVLIIYSEIRRINDHITQVFMSPTVNPRIQIDRIDNDLDYLIDFGVVDAKIERSTISEVYTLIGTYFAPGHMRLRWWPKHHLGSASPTQSLPSQPTGTSLGTSLA